MCTKLSRALVTLLGLVSGMGLLAGASSPASAMPIFAQRYHLTCGACHTALPELNDFGNYFRDHGYRLPPPAERHGTTVVALRYNLGWEESPVPGSRRFSPSASVLADQDIGAINAYFHYGLEAGGAPPALFLGFLSTYNQHTQTLLRAGLYELPLPQSPGQRLDDISTYGYYATSVGQNDLDLNAPRLGVEIERTTGATKLALSIAPGEFKGSAYGGAPVNDQTVTVAARPEIELYAHSPVFKGLFDVNALVLDGMRSIHLAGRSPFLDPYERVGFGLHTSFFHKRLDLEGEQFLGRDYNADGAGGAINSSGGWGRLKYFVTPHVYAAARYDVAANPFPTRTLVLYAGALVTKHARIVIEHRNNLIRGTPTLGAQLIVGVPWPLGY